MDTRIIDAHNPPGDLRDGEIVRLRLRNGWMLMKIDPATRQQTDVVAEFTVCVQPSGAACALPTTARIEC